MKQEPQPAQDITRILPWLVIFRSFSLAFDTSKLLLAALGILTTATGWWVLSFIFTLGYDAKPPSGRPPFMLNQQILGQHSKKTEKLGTLCTRQQV